MGIRPAGRRVAPSRRRPYAMRRLVRVMRPWRRLRPGRVDPTTITRPLVALENMALATRFQNNRSSLSLAAHPDRLVWDHSCYHGVVCDSGVLQLQHGLLPLLEMWRSPLVAWSVVRVDLYERPSRYRNKALVGWPNLNQLRMCSDVARHEDVACRSTTDKCLPGCVVVPVWMDVSCGERTIKSTTVGLPSRGPNLERRRTQPTYARARARDMQSPKPCNNNGHTLGSNTISPR